MLRIAIIIFREAMEIALMICILMAMTKNISNSRVYIIMGCILGVIGASLFAFFAKTITLSLSGIGDEVLDVIIILLTVLIIIITVVWMQSYSKNLKNNLQDLSIKINGGNVSKIILISVAGSTILRETIEIMLYVYTISSLEAIDMDDYILGFIIGAFSGLIMGILIYWGLMRFASKYIFKISTIMLVFIAASLASEAASILTSSGMVEIFDNELWNTSYIIDDSSFIGKFLKGLVGYTARPNGMQIIFYLSTIFIILSLIKLRKVLYIKLAR